MIKQIKQSILEFFRLGIGLTLFFIGFAIAVIGILENALPEIIGGAVGALLGIMIITPKRLYEELIEGIIASLPFSS